MSCDGKRPDQPFASPGDFVLLDFAKWIPATVTEIIGDTRGPVAAIETVQGSHRLIPGNSSGFIPSPSAAWRRLEVYRWEDCDVLGAIASFEQHMKVRNQFLGMTNIDAHDVLRHHLLPGGGAEQRRLAAEVEEGRRFWSQYLQHRA